MWFNLSVYCVVIDVKAHLQLDGWLSKLMWGMCQIPIRYAVVMKVHYTVYMLYYRDCGQLTPQLRVGKLTASWKERSSRSSAAHVVVLPPPDRCILVKSSLNTSCTCIEISWALQYSRWHSHRVLPLPDVARPLCNVLYTIFAGASIAI